MLMPAVSTIAGLLSQLPASPDHPGINAGISFALNRHVSPLERSREPRVLVERIDDIRAVVASLHATEAVRSSRGSDTEEAAVAGLMSVEIALQDLKGSLRRMALAAEA
jgi:predicted dienelactone hydrolase